MSAKTLVERLRAGDGDDWAVLLDEAADEIDRLRAALERIAASKTGMDIWDVVYECGRIARAALAEDPTP